MRKRCEIVRMYPKKNPGHCSSRGKFRLENSFLIVWKPYQIVSYAPDAAAGHHGLVWCPGVTFTLRRIIWSDGKPSMDREDYRVVHIDKGVGRIYRTTVPAGERWWWTLYGETTHDRPLPCGLTETLDEAIAAFKAAWDKN